MRHLKKVLNVNNLCINNTKDLLKMSENITKDEEAMVALFALGVFNNQAGGAGAVGAGGGGGRGGGGATGGATGSPTAGGAGSGGNVLGNVFGISTPPSGSPNSGAGSSGTPITPIGRALTKAGGLLKNVTNSKFIEGIRTRLQGLRKFLSTPKRQIFNDKVKQLKMKQLQELASKDQTLKNAQDFIVDSPSQGESKQDGKSSGLLGRMAGAMSGAVRSVKNRFGRSPKPPGVKKLDFPSDEEYFNKLFEKLLQEIIIKAQPEGWLIQELKSKQEEIINKFRNADPEQIESVQLYFQRKSIIGEILQDYIINRIRENKNLMANAIKTEVEQKEQQQARADKAEAKAKEVQKELAESQAKVLSLQNGAPSEAEKLRIPALEAQKNSLEVDNANLKQTILSMRQALTKTRTKVGNLQKDFGKKDAELTAALAALEEAKREKDAAVSKGTEENAALNEQKNKLEAALTESKKQNDLLTGQLNERDAEKTEMEAKIQSLSAEIERLQALGKQEAEKLKKARQAVEPLDRPGLLAVGTPPEGGSRMFTQRPGADEEAQPVISKGEKPKIEAQEARARAQRAQEGTRSPLQTLARRGWGAVRSARRRLISNAGRGAMRARIDDSEITLDKLRNDKSLLKNLNNTNVIKKLYKEIGGDTREGKDRTQMKKQIMEKLLAEEKAKIGGESKNLYNALRF